MQSLGKKQLNKKGFTLIEIIVTLVIIGIVAAVAVPSIVGYIIKMNQQSREQMALAMFKISQTAITHEYSSGDTDELFDASKSVSADKISPKVDVANSGRIAYISIDRDDVNKSNNELYKLLDPYIIDKKNLDQTILIEYDRTNGKVLAAFYSDETDSINYGSGAGYNAYVRDKDSLRKGKMGYWDSDSWGSVSGGLGEDSLNACLVDYNQIENGQGNDINNGNNYGLLTLEIILPNDAEPAAYDYNIALQGSGKDSTVNISNIDFSKLHTNLKDCLDDPDSRGMYIAGPAENSSGRNVLVIVLDSAYSGYSIHNNYYRNLGMGSITADISATLGSKTLKPDPAVNTEHSYFDSQQGNNETPVYYVSSIRHLNNIRYNNTSAADYVQTKDVYCETVDRMFLNFIPIGDNDGFAGTYLGMDKDNAYKIYNYTSSGWSDGGVFTKLTSDAVVNGITLDYESRYYDEYASESVESAKTQYFVSGTDNAGGITGVNRGVIKNCTVNGRVSLLPEEGTTKTAMGSGGNVGGITGNNEKTIEGCAVSASVYAQDVGSAGGIAGYSKGKISNCETGTACGIIKSKGNNRYCTFVGTPYYGANPVAGGKYTSGDIQNNAAEIKSVEHNGYADGCAGGVVGKVDNQNSNVTYCINASKVRGYDAGGLIGSMESQSLLPSKLSYSYNAGDVSGCSAVGGIAGDVSSMSTLSTCYNTGDVDCDQTVSKASYMGGIAGYCLGARVEYCYNMGSVKNNALMHGGAFGWVSIVHGADCAYLAQRTESAILWYRQMSDADLRTHDFSGKYSTGNAVGPFNYPYPHFNDKASGLGEDFHRTPWE